MTSKIPKPIGEETIKYQGKIVEVVEQEFQIGEKVKTFEKARRSPGVRLIVLTPEGSLLLTSESRVELNGGFDVRLPGGKVYDTLNEYNDSIRNTSEIEVAAKDAAIKEAREELGIEVSELELVYISKIGATVEWDLYYFMVTKYEVRDSQSLEDGEVIDVVEVSMEEAWKACVEGNVSEDRSAAVLMRILAERLSK